EPEELQRVLSLLDRAGEGLLELMADHDALVVGPVRPLWRLLVLELPRERVDREPDPPHGADRQPRWAQERERRGDEGDHLAALLIAAGPALIGQALTEQRRIDRHAD